MTLEDLKNKAGNGANSNADTNNDNKEALEKAEQDKKNALERAAKAEFDLAFSQSSATYPLAKEYENDIREKVKAGYSVDDAVVSVLQKNGKLKTQDDITREANKGTGLGGSASNGNIANTGNADKEPTLEEAEKAFKEAEARGEILLN